MTYSSVITHSSDLISIRETHYLVNASDTVLTICKEYGDFRQKYSIPVLIVTLFSVSKAIREQTY